MTELEYLDEIDKALKGAWDEAVSARDSAQSALEQIMSIRRELLTERRLELQTAQLAELQKA